jgi:hypothetical protein
VPAEDHREQVALLLSQPGQAVDDPLDVGVQVVAALVVPGGMRWRAGPVAACPRETAGTGRRAAVCGRLGHGRSPVSLGRVVSLNNARSHSRGSKITRDIRQRGKSNPPPLTLPEPHSASPDNTENIPNSPEYISAGKSYGMITEEFTVPWHHRALLRTTRHHQSVGSPHDGQCTFFQYAAGS